MTPSVIAIFADSVREYNAVLANSFYCIALRLYKVDAGTLPHPTEDLARVVIRARTIAVPLASRRLRNAPSIT